MDGNLAKYFEVHAQGDHFVLFDLGTSRRSQSWQEPQYLPGKFTTREGAEAHAAEVVGDRGEL